MKKIIFTGGGTAGHVTPNLALMDHFDPKEWEMHYIGSKDGIEKQLLKDMPDLIYHEIDAGKLRRYISVKNLTDPVRVIKGFAESKQLIREIAPDVVFSKGGYVSVPVVAAAKGTCPVICHESDYSPGLANKLAARFADSICVTFEDTLSYIKDGKGIWTGTPVRKSLFTGSREAGLRFAGLAGDKPVLLCTGGSLGAQAVNEALRASLPELLKDFDVIHLCGKGKADPACIQKGYAQFEYVSEEMKDLLAAADVVLSRAGANSVFELLALHIPAVLVPLPLEASRGDQILNANYFEKKGYSYQLDQHKMTPGSLTEAIRYVFNNRETYIQNMRSSGSSDSNEKIYNMIREAAYSHD